MPPNQPFLVGIAIGLPLVALSFLYFAKDRRYRNTPLPPGPKGLPFIGNALNIPPKLEWKTYREWCKQADSDIIYFSAFGQHIVVIDTYETAIELLEKRSGIYSSRHQVPMMVLSGWDAVQIGLTAYGTRWRTRRRIFHDILNEKTNPRYYPLIQRNMYRLLNFLVDDPDNFMTHIHLISSSTSLEIAYGLEAKSIHDPRHIKFERAISALMQSTNAGAYLVNTFPLLQYVPAWFPGAGFKKHAKEQSVVSKEIVEGTYKEAKEMIFERGQTSPSLVYDSLSQKDVDKEEEERIMSAAVSLYAAGADTTASILQVFVLAMVLYPEVQKRAQDEIARVCQSGHFPSYDDRDSYPYLSALIMEVFRWGCIVPMSLPHKIDTDDIYRGYYIPAGTIVIPNQWSMSFDEKVYPDPEPFKPERFLKYGAINPDVRNPYEIAFGFGRRICPGLHMALMSLWTNAAAILATLELENVPGGPDHDIEPVSGLVIHPPLFKCSIKPRSAATLKQIREALA